MLLFVKQSNEFLPDHVAVFFQSFHPLERFGVYDRAVSHWRLVRHPVLDGVTKFFQRRLMARLRNSLKLMRAADPKAKRDMHD